MNEYLTEEVVYGRAFVQSLLGAEGARPAAALLATGKVRLTKDPTYNPTPDTTLASLTANETAYSGYAAGGIALTTVGPLNMGPEVVGNQATVLFQATAATPFVADEATGWWVDDGVNFIAGERFAANGVATFGAPGDFLALDVRLPLPLRQAAA